MRNDGNSGLFSFLDSKYLKIGVKVAGIVYTAACYYKQFMAQKQFIERRMERQPVHEHDQEWIELKCPISMEMMRDPVVIDCGHTFDRSSIERQVEFCPLCRVPIHSVRPNYALKEIIRRYED